MGRKTLQLKNYTVSDIKAFIKSEDKYRIGMRLSAICQLANGVSSRQLEELYNTSFKQICNWANRFDKDGVEGLRDKSKSGRIAKLSVVQKEQLKEILQNKTPENYGYNTATWSGAIVRELIRVSWGVEYQKAQIYNILRELGFTFQRAKGVYPEANKKLQEEFAQTIKKTSNRT